MSEKIKARLGKGTALQALFSWLVVFQGLRPWLFWYAPLGLTDSCKRPAPAVKPGPTALALLVRPVGADGFVQKACTRGQTRAHGPFQNSPGRQPGEYRNHRD